MRRVTKLVCGFLVAASLIAAAFVFATLSAFVGVYLSLLIAALVFLWCIQCLGFFVLFGAVMKGCG